MADWEYDEYNSRMAEDSYAPGDAGGSSVYGMGYSETIYGDGATTHYDMSAMNVAGNEVYVELSQARDDATWNTTTVETTRDSSGNIISTTVIVTDESTGEVSTYFGSGGNAVELVGVSNTATGPGNIIGQ
jgi:hypothetical protein